MKREKLWLAKDRAGTMFSKGYHLYRGTEPPTMHEGVAYDERGCQLVGTFDGHCIEGPKPNPGTFVECRLTVTKAGAP